MNAITTRLSTKGQLILPKEIRDRLKWKPGTELVVEDTPGGVVIRAARTEAPATLDQLFGVLHDGGQPLSIEDMDRAIADAVLKHDARSRH